jgi:23S rRNA (cytosine1962-C5)-methyltransferase
MRSTVVVGPRGAERAKRGHPWIYRSDVADVRAAAGDLVEVVTSGGRRIGDALYSDRSQIALRLVTLGAERGDVPLVRRRIDEAIDFRARLAIDGDAYRLVHAEGDRLPSLVVDRYGDVLVVQALSQGMDRILGDVVELLRERLRPRAIVARHDVRVRALEGLSQSVEVLFGDVPETIVVRDRDLEFEVDVLRGQKTGAFLDQRENRWAAAGYARGRLLDAFGYDGGFALRAARQCSEALVLDVAADTVMRIEKNAERNGLGNVRAEIANAFDFLREIDRAGERFDTIVLDPPAFAKSRDTVARALSGYKEINLRAVKLLERGGTLVTCSCSYHVTEAMLLAAVEDAARDAHATLSLVEKRQQSRDHPTLLGVPETAYLKCLILRKL